MMVNARLLLLAADGVLVAARRRLRGSIGAEALWIEAAGLLEHRRGLVAELLARHPAMFLRRRVGEAGIPPVEPGIAVEMRDQCLLIGHDRIAVAQAELGVGGILTDRAGDHDVGHEANRLLRLDGVWRVTIRAGFAGRPARLLCRRYKKCRDHDSLFHAGPQS